MANDTQPFGDQEDRSGSYQRSLRSRGKEPRQQQDESENEIIVAGDDAVILTDGGEPPSLVGNTGANEDTDIEVDEKIAYRVQTKLTSEVQARQIRNDLLRIGVSPDKIELVTERVGVDSR